ncbi:MAG: MraY family glycosyltransferase [Verrucomicrobiota bacterium]
MEFPLNIYLLSLLSATLVSALSLPLWRAWCRRTNHVDDPGHRKIHTEPIALAGGLAVATGLFVPILFGLVLLFGGGLGESLARSLSLNSDSLDAIRYGIEKRALQLGVILFGAFGMLFLGWWDDRHELTAAPKFLGQLAIASLVAAVGVRVTLFVPYPIFGFVITVLWILTLINALNFMDNMNGLCGGLGLIGAWFLGMSAAIHGQYLVASLAALSAGALLGFLPYNFPKASVFLGDAGSHLVGYLLAVLAILPSFHTPEHPNTLAVLVPLLILAVPLGDLVCVVIIRYRLGKPFWIGDNNHLSHRLVRRGLSKPTTVLVIWLLAGLAGIAGLLILR